MNEKIENVLRTQVWGSLQKNSKKWFLKCPELLAMKQVRLFILGQENVWEDF